MDTQIGLASKMIDRRTSTPKGNHTYGPFFLEYSLLAEFNLLQKQKMPGVYVIPSSKSPLVWFGVLFIRQGMYQEGVFRFKLFIPENFPDGDCPKLVFDDFVFHPIVDPKTFELDLRRGFHKWKRNVNHIWQVLLYARRIFYKIDTKDPLNREAANIHQENLDGYRARVSDCVAQWRKRLYKPNPEDADDPHYIKFSPFEAQVHGPLLDGILATTAGKNCDNNDDTPFQSLGSTCSTATTGSTAIGVAANGMSFMESGSLKIFSRNAAFS